MSTTNTIYYLFKVLHMTPYFSIRKDHRLRIFLLGLAVVLGSTLMAQEPIKQKTVDITSTFKPTLKEAAKINFSATPPPVDTSRPKLNYNIPNQNLYFTYQPIALSPMAFQADSTARWNNSNFIKAGFGNYSSPYLQAGFSFGDGAGRALTIGANHHSAKGSLDFQDFSNTQVQAYGTTRNKKNQEWSGGLLLSSSTVHRYGYDAKGLPVDVDTLRMRYQTIGGEIGFRNVEATAFGISYQPKLSITSFSDQQSNNEANTRLFLPIQKGLGENIGIDLSLTADLTLYKRADAEVINNNLLMLSPSLFYKSNNIQVTGGIRPTWDNGAFAMLPNVLLEVGTKEKEFIMQAGWIGDYTKTTYQRLAGYNPFLARPDSLLNTRMTELFGGIKGALGSNFSFGAKLGFQTHRNVALFVNDQIDGKSFDYLNEDKVNALALSGELGYSKGEQFSLRAGLKTYRFTGQRTYDEMYGVIPSEITGALRWQPIKDLFVKADLFVWEGNAFRRPDLTNGKQSGAFDLNAGLEFRITRSFHLWLQMNNIMNNRYQRWNQYEVLGFNFLGGVVFRFDQL